MFVYVLTWIVKRFKLDIETRKEEKRDTGPDVEDAKVHGLVPPCIFLFSFLGSITRSLHSYSSLFWRVQLNHGNTIGTELHKPILGFNWAMKNQLRLNYYQIKWVHYVPVWSWKNYILVAKWWNVSFEFLISHFTKTWVFYGGQHPRSRWFLVPPCRRCPFQSVTWDWGHQLL